MDIVRLAISKPVGVAVGVILVVMFGLIGLTAIPVQLTPTVDRPIITIETDWPGRSPEEIVDEVIRNQEEELKNVSGLKRMEATATEGLATIELEFYIGTSIPRALQEVSDNLRQVPDYPEEVEEPRVEAADGASENAIAWMIVDVDPDAVGRYPGFDIASLFDPLDKEVKPFIERIDGVAEVNIFGGREREVHVELDTTALAQRDLSHLDVIAALNNQNATISAGTIAEGKRDYRVRVVGRYEQLHQVEETVVAFRDGVPVYVKDIGAVRFGLEKERGFVRTFGHPSIAINVIRQTGANVVDVMDDLRGRLDTVREDILPNLAPAEFPGLEKDLRLRQVYDETTYIDSAISLVTSNLFIGGVIASAVLLVFLRSVVSTAIIAFAIPISVVGTFLVMLAMGRTLNIISLAGLAFAVGMVVDNAIVVLENIYRRLQNGDKPLYAAWQGGREVWGAILASTLTTAAVFIPVLTIQEEAGQLFRDIAIAIVAAVILSLLVSITVIPAASARLLRAKQADQDSPKPRRRGPLARLDRAASALAEAFRKTMLWLMTGARGYTLRPLIIAGMTAASLVGAVLLTPPLDYLPAGNRNLVFGGLLTPPGLSVEERERIAQRIEAVVKPYVDAEERDYGAMDAEPILRMNPQTFEPLTPFQPVPIQNFFIGSRDGATFFGATSDVAEIVIPVGQLLTNAANGMQPGHEPIPDVFGGAQQSSIFGRGAGGGNTVDLEVSGESLDKVLQAANFMYQQAGQVYGFGPTGANAEPSNFNLQQPEWRLALSDRARELGLTTRDVGTAVRGLFDGAFAGEFEFRDDNIDIMVLPLGGRLPFKEQLLEVPIATPSGAMVPVDSLVEITPALAPQDIIRVEELPAVIIRVQPRQGETVEEVERTLQELVIAPALDAGLLDRTMRVRLEGTAAKLDEVRAALFGRPLAQSENRTLRNALWALAAAIGLAGLVTAAVVAVRASSRRCPKAAYGVAGALALAVALALPLFFLGWSPALVLARMVWALLVTYLLMAALFESFVYPLVIMFSVPLAIVGGFLGLRVVHVVSLADPTKAPQNLDVLTMLGFVILIGVVVNNAILIVHQSLNFMRGVNEPGVDKPGEDAADPMPPLPAIAEAVKTRVRPIFMSVLTSVGGMLPLVLFPGAGSEMYRGLGSVVVGGLVVSTVFTLVLVPLLFSLTLEAVEGLKLALAAPDREASRPQPRRRREPARDEPKTEPEPVPQPA